jgi:hypothetical protein
MQALIELAKWFAVVAAGFATMGLDSGRRVGVAAEPSGLKRTQS